MFLSVACGIKQKYAKKQKNNFKKLENSNLLKNNQYKLKKCTFKFHI